jgi:uncharacterized coiled-coil protein SlyX
VVKKARVISAEARIAELEAELRAANQVIDRISSIDWIMEKVTEEIDKRDCKLSHN